MRVGLLALVATTAHALRPSMMLLPGASTGRITEDEARKRTSWPHWKRDSDWTADEEEAPAVTPPPPATKPQRAYKRESDWTADEEEPAVAPPPPTKPQKAYTLAYFQDRVKARARKEALLGLVAATGRLCDAARRDDDAIEAELADVLRALTEVAAERDVPLDALARRIDS